LLWLKQLTLWSMDYIILTYIELLSYLISCFAIFQTPIHFIFSIPSHPIPSHPIPSHLISSHPHLLHSLFSIYPLAHPPLDNEGGLSRLRLRLKPPPLALTRAQHSGPPPIGGFISLCATKVLDWISKSFDPPMTCYSLCIAPTTPSSLHSRKTSLFGQIVAVLREAWK